MLRLTIGHVICGKESNQFPSINLYGRWLKNLNWEIGQGIEVNATDEEIVIRRVEDGADSEGMEVGYGTVS